MNNFFLWYNIKHLSEENWPMREDCKTKCACHMNLSFEMDMSLNVQAKKQKLLNEYQLALGSKASLMFACEYACLSPHQEM